MHVPKLNFECKIDINVVAIHINFIVSLTYFENCVVIDTF